MGACTAFCESLKAILPSDQESIPIHDKLIERLGFTGDDKEQGSLLGTWQEIQAHVSCGFCQLVVAAVTHSVGPIQQGTIEPEQPLRILLFPGEQSFRLSYPSRLGLRLSFVVANGELVNAPDVARVVDTKGISTSQVRAWLNSCDENHKSCVLEAVEDDEIKQQEDTNTKWFRVSRGRFNESATSNIRVLDLESGCVRHVPLDVRYVTLSYVWGSLPMFRLRKDNFKQLSTPGALDSIRAQLPQTVKDAIQFLKEMGERYLWVDGLCLVQDDADDVGIGVSMMNSIYHGSYFTLVAGSGTDGNSGLPGFGGNPRMVNPIQIVVEISPGLKMTYTHSIDWHLSRSLYNNRGWTLQELVLPQRTVIFINGQVYFRCKEANWCEELWSDRYLQALDPDDSNIIRLPDPSDGFMPSCWAYQKLCEDYSRRKLRYDGDALRALSGITRPLTSGMETEVVEGLPGYYLDHFLLFISSSGAARRRPEFGSFSWAGWEGAIMFPRENFTWFDKQDSHTWDTTNILLYFKYCSLLQWRYLSESGDCEDLTSLRYKEVSPLMKLLREYPEVFAHIHPDAERDVSGSRWYSVRGIHGDVPRWNRGPIESSMEDLSRDNIEDFEDNSDIDRKLQSRSPFSIKGMDLANGGAEFGRLVKRVTGIHEKMALQNWMAMRRYRVNRVQTSTTEIGPRLMFEDTERDQYTFRQPYDEAKRDERRSGRVKDGRVEAGEHYQRNLAIIAGERTNDAETLEIPLFPPYPVLNTVTISIWLVLGHPNTISSTTTEHTAKQNHNEHGSPFSRIPGYPLLSDQNTIVGSLHPDNTEMLDPPGTKIELIVIARCNTPTIGSALLSTTSNNNDDEEDDDDDDDNDDETRTKKDEKQNRERRWNLLWVLHIIWREGIAERRGVGQILQSALESAVDPPPRLKSVLLG